MRARELVPQPAVRRIHRDASHRAQEQLVVGRHDVDAPQKDAARLVHPSLLRSALDQPQQLVLEVLQVAGGVLVEDHEIEHESLDPQILVRLE